VRKILALVSLAVTSMVALAFLIPSTLVLRESAIDRMTMRAQRRSGVVIAAVATSAFPDALAATVGTANTGGPVRIGVTMPDGSRIGPPPAATARALADVRDRGQADEVGTREGRAVLQPVQSPDGGVAVVEVDVRPGVMPPGTLTAWLVMLGVAICLVVCSILATDRLATRVVGSARRLARAAGELGAGDVGSRITPEGPPELREAADAFNAMADQIAQRLATERQLAADLSHRLRTPLTALRLHLDRLGRGSEMEKTRVAMRRLEHEINAVIKSAQRPGGDTAASCDAIEVVRDRVGFWSVLAEDQNREWRVSAPEPPVRVPVGRNELAAALDALLGNIFHHTPETTAYAVTVELGADRVGMLVSDAGPGIADPERMRERGRSTGGSTGLGLDIARRLAESTGGELTLGRSALGGTQAGLWLRTSATRRIRTRARRPVDTA
jgi:signal transduction histidine kinase